MKKYLFLLLLIISLTAMGQIDSTGNHDYITSSFELEAPLLTNTTLEGDLVPESDLLRRFYFIHGLGGSAASWTVAADACWNPDLNIPGFSPRNCYVSRPEYINSVTGNLSTAAYDVREQIRNTAQMDILNYGMDPNRSVLIGHSQGSLVGRSILHLDAPQYNSYPDFGRGYGGFVSIAGPLGGAKILNNRNKIMDMAEDACNKLTMGPAGDIPWLEPILTILQKKDLVPNTCNLVSQTILPMFFNDYFNNITNDYLVGASYLDNLRNDTLQKFYKNLPKVAAYAIEPKENILWRTANWLLNDPNDEFPFEANDDFKFYNNTIKPAYNYYVTNYAQHANNAEAYENLLGNPFFYLTIIGPIITYFLWENEVEASENWYEGVKWFNNANKQWETIIGGRELSVDITNYTSQNGSILDFLTQYPSYYYAAVQSLAQNLQLPRNQFITYTLMWTLHANDGIVTAESAIDLDKATASPVRIYGANSGGTPKSMGSSHMQVRNDSGLKEFFLDLFDGNYGLFFKTNRVYH